MAKENYVWLIGQVRKEPTMRYDSEQRPIRASFVLTTIKRNIHDNAGMYSPKFDYPYIETSDPSLIEIIQSIKLYDFIEIKGTFATKNIKRGKKCPHCDHVMVESGTLDYVEPIYIGIRAHATSNTDGADYLRQCAEVSNTLKLVGTVCQDPRFYTYENGTDYALYNVAVNRKFFVNGQPETSADFPWVKTYGEQATKDKGAIKKGALIYIDGALKTEKASQKVVCEECGQEYDFEQIVLIAKPYSVEYLEGCHLPDPDPEPEEHVNPYFEKGKDPGIEMDGDDDGDDEGEENAEE